MMKKPTGAAYWRSLDELQGTPEFQEALARELPGEIWETIPPATRRQFLKVMGASLALAGLTSCRWPREEIVPATHRPEGREPGETQRFATAMELAGAASGLLVTSYDGRPIKIEGNPEHPASRGAASAVAQASLLELYDPDRSRNIVEQVRGTAYNRTWDQLAGFLSERATALGKNGGQGLAVLSEATSSVTVAGLRRRLQEKLPGMAWYEYEVCSRDTEREGIRRLAGRALRPVPRLDNARVIACFDADPLLGHPDAVRLGRELAEARRPGTEIARLWVAEPVYTITGATADRRLPVPARRIPLLLAGVVARLASHGIGVTGAGAQEPPGLTEAERAFARELAADLAGHRGAAVLLAGPGQGPEVHTLIHAINLALGSAETLDFVPDPGGERPAHTEAIATLAERMDRGEIDTLLILGGNPAYDAPAGLDFAARLGKVPHSVHLAGFRDETSARCSWHVPRAHYLEAWADARSWDGTLSVVQPLIEPLYGGRTPAELLAAILGEPAGAYDLVRAGLRGLAPAAGFERFWNEALRTGVVPVGPPGAVTVRPDAGAVSKAFGSCSTPPAGDGLELLLRPDPKVLDGRFANNGWLQELPESITKITWDNALLLSPATAKNLGVQGNDVVRVTAGGASVEAPVYVVPGQAAATAFLALGYGRRAAGAVGYGVGADAYVLRKSDAPGGIAGATIEPTGATHVLACTQNHHAIDTIGFESRLHRLPELVREATLEEYLEHGEELREEYRSAPLFSLWKERTYEGDQWGMAIDLNACYGCNACIVACQAENNIPVVGRERVIEGREMQWIRVDRYFKGGLDTAELVFQPVTCVQCEDAPCEQVCPVAATQHTHDGLNAMVYNRCVGTRYCSNNCPYKVRRFNFFNYQKGLDEVEKMRYNPEVTVRSRGVMEKCTYCVQRIEAARIAAKKEDRPIRDGEIVTACQQTCPAQAIVFGNLNDPGSEVSKLRESNRAYGLLAELNVRPRTHYLARLRNPGEAGERREGEG